MEDWDSGLTTYGYDGAGRLAATTLPNGVVSVNEYDAAGRLINLTHTAADDTLLSSYSYELDGVGNRVQVTETLTGTSRVIDYVYDPLNRLTEATYSTGESFAYQYDAVGNRTAMTETTSLDETTVTTYTYDAANRLLVTSSPGHLVSYAWDDRGNLVSDGTFTYAYNAAGRMVRAESVTVTLVYTYTADGLRVAQSVQSVGESVDSFAWDWASAVPEMLNDGDNLYLVGYDTLGRWDGAAWAYHLPDALGSIRQATDDTGAVTSSREWTPFGVEVGAAQAGLGYTGEWQDLNIELLYLRARWYAHETGRFTRRDPREGSIQQPQTMLPGYVYVGNRPVNAIDPSGLFQSPYDIPAGHAVMLSKWLYSQGGLLRNCSTEADDGQWPSDTVDDLLTDFVCEYGPEHRYFFADAHLTRQLAKSIIIHQLREQMYWEAANPLEGTYYFETPDFFKGLIDAMLRGDITRFVYPWVKQDITSFMGTFDYRISWEEHRPDKIRFEIYNETELASGSRIPPILGGVHPGEKGVSVEEVLESNPGLATEPLSFIIATNPIISILERRTRPQTTGLEGGGAMEQTFIWCEKYPLLDFGCTFFLPPWPAVLPFLSDAIGFCHEACGGGSH